jgi:hypothetical protein
MRGKGDPGGDEINNNKENFFFDKPGMIYPVYFFVFS